MKRQDGSALMRRLVLVRSMTPAQAALAGRMKNYKGRTHGTVSTYNAGCRCTDCRETKRKVAEKWRRKNGAKARYKDPR